MPLFGITCGQRILPGETDSHFAFQEIVMISGPEQSIALTSAGVLIGFRGYRGFEFGIGPIYTGA